MKSVIITGVSRGIGRALAYKFLLEGYSVIGTSTDGICDILNDKLSVYKLDLSKIEEGLETITQYLGDNNISIDLLINNAGAVFGQEDNLIDIGILRKTLEVNLIGTIDFTQKILPFMNKDNGHIINISSRAGSFEDSAPIHYPSNKLLSYKISKASLNMFTKILSDIIGNKIRVSSIHPGWVKTRLGGLNAEITPEESADNIYNLAISNVKSGKFWFNTSNIKW